MSDKNKDRSVLLIALQLFLGVGAIFGGGALTLDPSGDLLGMPLSMLEGSIFSSFLVPGIILLVVLGVIPVIIAIGLTCKWTCAIAEKLNVFRDKHWSWTFSLYSGFCLIIWITVQIYIIHGVSVVHIIYMGLGLLIQATSLLPSVQKKYERTP
ncbi:hypothetical protein BVG16_23395 [Paenibacillus selenitireducens]|uniref:Uncharacterized protein n=1 Tax=Paenibacillus selenitireducens TaxID=1324314 RepID=A0A1T2X485_9BACL|nr:hypothetical protein [Paenibacillus selenitireducens]OPA74704.1 hypothetical protein BVG16_23395 [Paenibacillus selenitireducens]